ncbi:MAG: hypothetical protein IKT35_01705, partial [Clostridia bacterium]|nr:hypothetical protein [Clostridia bacterium]
KSLNFDISSNSGRLLIGILSDRAEALHYFDGAGLDYGMVQSETIVMDDEMFPEDAKGLELLDLLVISHYDTDRLSDALDECMFTEKKYTITGRDTGCTCEEFADYVMSKL